MSSYLFKRASMAFFSVLIVTSLTFSLLSLMPGNTATVIIQEVFVGDRGYVPTASEIAKVREMYGLNEPLYLRYFHWLGNALRGNFGISYMTGMPVSDEIWTRLKTTITLATISGIMTFIFAISAGLYSASKRGYIIDKVLTFFSGIFVSVPEFLLGMILMLVFSLKMNLFPVSGWGSPTNMVLPAVTLAMGRMAFTTRIVRASSLDVMEKEYITTARAKGLKENHILTHHVLKNALIPVMPYIGLEIGSLLSGAMIVETLFSIPGLGQLLVNSIIARDMPVIQACAAVIALMYATANIIADEFTRILDPRIRFEGKK